MGTSTDTRNTRLTPNPPTSISILPFFIKPFANHRDLHSFPTRRSSDLSQIGPRTEGRIVTLQGDLGERVRTGQTLAILERDRKSTRLNSSHVAISYAVFCLK